MPISSLVQYYQCNDTESSNNYFTITVLKDLGHSYYNQYSHWKLFISRVPISAYYNNPLQDLHVFLLNVTSDLRHSHLGNTTTL